MADVFTDLATETEALAALAERHGYGTAPDVTPYFSRLTSTARLVRLSIESPAAFGVTSQVSFDSLDEAILGWLVEQRKANALLAAAEPAARLPWREGPLAPPVLAAAALSELFACGQDLADTFGIRVRRGDSIEHVAGYGVRTRDRVYRRHGLIPAGEPFRFELTAPSGAVWSFGPAAAGQRVTGPAEDFCLVVTGHCPRPGAALETHGRAAAEWLRLAQN